MSKLSVVVSKKSPVEAMARISSELRSFDFLTSNDLSWQDFKPRLTPGGTMTVTQGNLNVARFYQIDELVFFYFQTSGITTGGVASSFIYFDLPVAPDRQFVNFCNFSGKGIDGGNTIMMYGTLYDTQRGSISRYDGAVFGLGASRTVSMSGFYPVLNK